MKSISMFYILMVCAAAVAAMGAKVNKDKSAPRDIILPFEEIGLFDPLPAALWDAPVEFREKWIRAYNETAVLQAQRRADSYRVRNPVLDVYVQNHEYTSQSSLDQNASNGYYNSHINAETYTSYRGRSVQRTYRPDQWGGGPVVVINPYINEEVGHEK